MANPLMETEFEELISHGREKGQLTFDEINKLLPDDVSTADMETLLDELEEMQIDVVGLEDEEKDETLKPIKKELLAAGTVSGYGEGTGLRRERQNR